MKILFVLTLMLPLLAVPIDCQAQSADEVEALRADVEELRRGQDELKESLIELIETLRPVLERLPKPFRPQEVAIEGSPVQGKDSARVTVVEFSDLQCSFCVKYYNETFPQLVKNYVDTGKIRYVAREFPLTTIHKEAQRASQAALCAGDRYWDLREVIFKNRQKLSEDDLAAYAAGSGVEIGEWRACMESNIYVDKVREDMRDAQELGIKGTPGFVFGLTDPDNLDSFRAVKMLPGAYPYDEFEKVINGLLEGEGE